MKTQSLGLWWLRIATFSVAALAAASAAYWVLKWTAGTPTVPLLPAAPGMSHAPQSDPQVVARLLGGGQQAVVATLSDSAASRFKLIGVIADKSKGGYALISVDGKAAKPFAVGAQVNDAMVLHSVAPRSAALATSTAAPVSLTLNLPPPSSDRVDPRSAPGPVPAQAQALPASQAQIQAQPQAAPQAQAQPPIQPAPQVEAQPHMQPRSRGRVRSSDES